MPAKKNASSSAKKPTSPKGAKTAAKAARKSATKKSVAKKTTKTDPEASSAKENSAASEKPAKSLERIKASALKREQHTPAIFKNNKTKAAAAVFSIQDARELLKKRQKEEAASIAEKDAKDKATQAVASKAAPTVTDIDPASIPKSKHAAASLADILGFNPANPQKAGASPVAGDVPAKWEKYYNLLIELRKEVRDELNLHSNDTLKRSQKDDAGDISTSVDAGTDNFDRDFALNLLSSEQEALNEIEGAIQRIHKGTYGICEITHKPISQERLEAVPFTRFSLEGQKQHEMNSRRRVQRTGAFLNEGSADTLSFGDDDGDN